jgi:hypothetical protein
MMVKCCAQVLSLSLWISKSSKDENSGEMEKIVIGQVILPSAMVVGVVDVCVCGKRK